MKVSDVSKWSCVYTEMFCTLEQFTTRGSCCITENKHCKTAVRSVRKRKQAKRVIGKNRIKCAFLWVWVWMFLFCIKSELWPMSGSSQGPCLDMTWFDLYTFTSGCTQTHFSMFTWECMNTLLFLLRHTHTPLWVAASPCLFAPAGPLVGGWSSQHQPVALFAHGPPQLPLTTGLYSATFPVTS